NGGGGTSSACACGAARWSRGPADRPLRGRASGPLGSTPQGLWVLVQDSCENGGGGTSSACACGAARWSRGPADRPLRGRASGPLGSTPQGLWVLVQDSCENGGGGTRTHKPFRAPV